jgi:2-C-methyl-D-erythritol 4-phosphate cytidylyltransferase/2-C-methyl-D-erythritol 2,4-cyclodiphosphate synthase
MQSKTDSARAKANWAAVIVAGGSGTRMGRPKQMLPLAGRAVLFRSIDVFAAMPEFSSITVTTSGENFAALDNEFGSRITLAEAGQTRLASLKNAFALVPSDARAVAVHDGARPLVTAALVRSVCEAAIKTGAAVPAVPVNDTIKSSRDGKMVEATPERATLWAAQTPQCYTRETLCATLERFADAGDVSDESQLAERAGFAVAIVKSSYENIKITTPQDMAVAEALMQDGSKKAARLTMRVGMGYDLHRLVAGRPLIMAGITLPHGKGLLGHSDGDVVLHAVCDAALGAIAAGEIGVYFPPTDVTIMGISSRAIAEKTLEVLSGHGARLAQIDVTVIAEEPKLLPHYAALRKSLSEIFRLPQEQVSLKAKSSEGLGHIGRGEAIACHAIAVVQV